jgi:hypothetical protein
MLEATRIVQQRYFDSGHSSGFELALTCARLGRAPDAVAALKGAIAAHDYNVLGISTNPGFTSLQGDPAFQDLLRQVTERIYRA